ncbi:MAG: penicillin-insensitive murein endopeptidase, partial [Hyphomicrobium sp.]
LIMVAISRDARAADGAKPAAAAVAPPVVAASPATVAPAAIAPAAPPAAPPAPPQPPAKALFGAMTAPAQLEARALGFYSRGCLAGARALPVDGPAWQTMRLARNRNWGHPSLVALVEKFAVEAREFDGWPGMLVGDMSQPRGGPMLTGHNSHQIGLDADIWFTPMPDRRLSTKEREDLSATSMLGPDKLSVDTKVWSAPHVQIIKRAASYAQVERVLVHPAIKKALCESAGTDRAWLGKVRPIFGHHYHFHIRMSCPAGSTGCVAQAAPPTDDGCGKELTDWFALLTRPPAPPPAKPVPPKPPLTLDQLPAECRTVLEVGIARPAGSEPPRVMLPLSAPSKPIEQSAD